MKFSRSWAAPLMVALSGFLGAPWANAQEGITRSSVVIGQSICLTGPGSSLSVPFHDGAKLYFDRINAAGGVNGRKIELVTLDDHGNAKMATDNTKKLLDQGVFSLFGYYGSPQVTAIYPMIKDSDVLLFAPMLVIVRIAESSAALDSLSVACRIASFFAAPSVSAWRAIAAASSA